MIILCGSTSNCKKVNTISKMIVISHSILFSCSVPFAENWIITVEHFKYLHSMRSSHIWKLKQIFSILVCLSRIEWSSSEHLRVRDKRFQLESWIINHTYMPLMNAYEGNKNSIITITLRVIFRRRSRRRERNHYGWN